MIRRDSDCPLCGAKMTPSQLLDACANLLAPSVDTLSARCPFCQGYLEVRPVGETLEIGYLTGSAEPHFERVLALPCPGLRYERLPAPPRLQLSLGERHWVFAE